MPPEALNPGNFVPYLLAALIIGVLGFMGPLSVAWYTGRQRQQERAEDKAERDEVASEARHAASKLVESNAEVAKAAKETGAQTLAAVGVIHTLVNSNLTDAIEGNLVSAEANLDNLQELQNLQVSLGHALAPESLTKLESAKAIVQDLKVRLEDRKRQGILAQTQIVAEEKRTESTA